jgi:D-sedoheptulose 7-phosphate isomerase
LYIETSERSVTAAVLARHICDLHEVLDNISPAPVERVVELILAAHRDGRHVYILGNGGSASTASHFACDLSKATIVGDASRLRVTSLTDNVAVLTAWANDTSYERVFAEQLLSLAAPGDVVVIISASGDSPNVLAAARTARELGAATVALVGFAGGALKDLVDVAVQVGSHDYGVVEDCQLVLEHAITASVRGALEG